MNDSSASLGLWLGSRAKIKSQAQNVPTKITTTRVVGVWWYSVVWYGVCVCVCVCVWLGNTVLTFDGLEWAYLFSEDLNPTPTP